MEKLFLTALKRPTRKSCMTALLFIGLVCSGLAKASILVSGPNSYEKCTSDLVDHHVGESTLSTSSGTCSDIDPSNEPLETDGADLAVSFYDDLIFLTTTQSAFVSMQTLTPAKACYCFAPRGPPTT